MSSGPDYPKMQLIVTEFVPSNREFLSLTYVEKAAAGDDHEFAHSYAPPLGVDDTVKQNLENICLSHMKSIITQSRSLGELLHGDTSVISWKAFEAVNRYRKHSSGTGGNRTLLQKACMLYAMHYFMSHIITFTSTSAEEAVTKLRASRMLPYTSGPILTSRLLNLQIKIAMHALMPSMMRDVLEGLEKLFAEYRSHSSWAESFCVVLILCTCIEAVQVSIDAFAIAALSRDHTCALHPPAMLRVLENTYKQVTELFHMAYKTARSGLGRTRRSGFNPIRDGLSLNESNGVTQQMADLVQDIRQIMKHHGKGHLLEEINEANSSRG